MSQAKIESFRARRATFGNIPEPPFYNAPIYGIVAGGVFRICDQRNRPLELAKGEKRSSAPRTHTASALRLTQLMDIYLSLQSQITATTNSIETLRKLVNSDGKYDKVASDTTLLNNYNEHQLQFLVTVMSSMNAIQLMDAIKETLKEKSLLQVVS